MATAKKPAPRKPTVSRTPSKGVMKPMPKTSGTKSATKKPLANTTKKPKVEGPSNYTPNAIYKLPMTPKQSIAYGKLAQSPKTSDTLFTLPKGAASSKMSQKEIDQMQARRVADRKRTLARAEAIIRRTR